MTEKTANEMSFEDKLLSLRADLMKQDWEDDGVFSIPSRPSGGYTYLTASKVKRQFNPCLVRAGLNMRIIFSELTKHEPIGNMSQHWTVKCTMTLFDRLGGGLGEALGGVRSVSYEAYGEAGDSGDKGINKAQTDAIKQIIFNQFLIADNSDPDENSADMEIPPVGRRIPNKAEQEAVKTKMADKAVQVPPKDEEPQKAPKKPLKKDSPKVPEDQPKVVEEKAEVPEVEATQVPAEEKAEDPSEPPMNRLQKAAIDKIVNEARMQAEDGMMTEGEFDALELEAQKVKTSRQASDFIVKHRRA